MLTSRAEYRIQLRSDNADQRLTPRGLAIGCVGPVRAQAWRQKAQSLESGRALIRELRASPQKLAAGGIDVNQDGQVRSVEQLLALPAVSWSQLTSIWPELHAIEPSVVEQLTIDARYRGYLSRQEADIRGYRADAAIELPPGLDYLSLKALSMEMRQKLATARPTTLAQAARIPGVTPAALTILLRFAKRRVA